MDSEISKLIITASETHNLDPEVVAAIVCQESACVSWAYRFELGFYTKRLAWRTRRQLAGWTPKPSEVPSLNSEKLARATSWGLMQVLGETARVCGYSGPYLSALCDPATGLHWGCLYFVRCLEAAKGERAALLRYNGGGDPTYPDKVYFHISSGAVHRVLGWTQ